MSRSRIVFTLVALAALGFFGSMLLNSESAATSPAGRAQDAAATLADSSATSADEEAAKQIALDYALGWYSGDAERMNRALHPKLAKRTVQPAADGGESTLSEMTAKELVDLTAAGHGTRTPEDIRRSDVTVLDIDGKMACVKLQMHGWTDYMQMAKIDGKWVIVNVLWEPRAATE